jgi:hypothetical protein
MVLSLVFFFIFIDTQPPQATLYKRDVPFRKENMRATSVCHTKHGNARCVSTPPFQSKTPYRVIQVPRNPSTNEVPQDVTPSVEQLLKHNHPKQM